MADIVYTTELNADGVKRGAAITTAELRQMDRVADGISRAALRRAQQEQKAYADVGRAREQAARQAAKAESEAERDAGRRIRNRMATAERRNAPLRADRGENPFTFESLGKSTGMAAGIGAVYAAKIGLDFIGAGTKAVGHMMSDDRLTQAKGAQEGVAALENIPIIGTLGKFVDNLTGFSEQIAKNIESMKEADAAAKKIIAAENTYAREVMERLDPGAVRLGGRTASLNADIREYNRQAPWMTDRDRRRASDALEARRDSLNELAAMENLDRQRAADAKVRGVFADRTAAGRANAVAQAELSGDKMAGLDAELGAEREKLEDAITEGVRAFREEFEKAERLIRKDPGYAPMMTDAQNRYGLFLEGADDRRSAFAATAERRRRDLQAQLDREDSRKRMEELDNEIEQNRYERGVRAGRFGLESRIENAGLRMSGEEDWKVELKSTFRRLQAEIASTPIELRDLMTNVARDELQAFGAKGRGKNGGIGAGFQEQDAQNKSVFGNDDGADRMIEQQRITNELLRQLNAKPPTPDTLTIN